MTSCITVTHVTKCDKGMIQKRLQKVLEQITVKVEDSRLCFYFISYFFFYFGLKVIKGFGTDNIIV